MHNGIDLVATKDGKTGQVDYILAHTGGVVEAVGYSSSAGYYAKIRVDAKTLMVYYHMREMASVKKGATVKKGEKLGYMGSTGNSTGAHLHLGISYKGNWIDPAPYLDKDYSEPAAEARKTASVALPVIRYGYRGEDVKAMQTLLILRGYNCGDSGADGIYGDATKTALEAFQEKRDLDPDAVCGKDTWTELITA